MDSRDITKKIQEDKGLQEAINNYDGYMNTNFSGTWQAVVYAMLVVLMIVNYTTYGFFAAFAAVPGIVFFYLVTKYDEFLVDMVNQKRAESVYTDYVVNNIHKYLDLQDTDSIEDLDGTNEDEICLNKGRADGAAFSEGLADELADEFGSEEDVRSIGDVKRND